MNDKISAASVLNSIYRDAALGSSAISDLLPKTENAQFRSDLRTQESEYNAICAEATNQLSSLGLKPDPIGAGKIVGMKASVTMNTIMNTDTSHLAEMMIQGSTNGITSMTKVLNGYPNPDPQVKGLADRLIQVEQQNIARLKAYLS